MPHIAVLRGGDQTKPNQTKKTKNNYTMSNQIIAKLGVLSTAILAIPAISFAGTASAGKDYKDHKMVEKCKESCISGDIGIDIVSMYIARGIPLENQGAIIQPYLDLSFRVYQGDGALTKLSVDLGLWDSFHSRKTGSPAGSTTRAWFESDFQAGLSFVFNKNLTVNPYYRAYMSPNDAFETAHDLGLRLAYDDTDLLGIFALHPYALVQFDIDGTSGNGNNNSDGVYYEIGIAPGLQAGPVALTLPIKARFGSNDYYAVNGYGALSVGVNAEYQLTCIPECLGGWSVHANATYYNLGEGTEGASVPAVRDTDDNEFVFGGGLRVTF